jgi:hypothetical protein
MPKLNDTQTMLLSTASQRDTLSLYPLPGALAKAGPRVTKAIAALVTVALAEERATDTAEFISRTDGNLSYGIFATAAGLAAIGVEAAAGQLADADAPAPAPAPASDIPPHVTKAALVLALLKRPQGATLPDLIAATGWLPHTTRSALTGLRKKGHAMERFKRDDATCYRIAG